MRRDVRIVLVGDEGVGKSTIITSLIKESFIPNVQHIVPEVTIPPEVTPEKVTTYIIDTGSKPDDRPHLDSEARKAHVICIVYAIDNPHSFSRIPAYWLPYFRQLGVNVPVILVGNKIDLRTSHSHYSHHGSHSRHPHPHHPSSNPNRVSLTNQSLEEEIAPIMADFKEVETCVETSAKLTLNISEVFYFAQKAVLHPTAPLYDSKEHVLKPACQTALRRIFKLCDVDKNGILDADELNEFQLKCFDSPLQAQELEGIQEMVRQHGPGGIAVINKDASDGLRSPSSSTSSFASLSSSGSSAHPPSTANGSKYSTKSRSSSSDSSTNGPHSKDSSQVLGLTELGFLYLHTIFIQRGRLETTWTVLRKFGYAEDLRLTEEFLAPKFDVPPGCSVELSQKGYEFFTGLFVGHDKDHDGALNAEELANVFDTSPGNPWTSQGFPDTTISDENGSVTLQGWLAQWSMTTLLDYKTTLAYLAYLGYPDSKTTNALKVSQPRRLERRAKLMQSSGRTKGKGKNRNVFLCWVCGAAGSGKTALLRSFIRKGYRDAYMPTSKPISVVNSVEVDGSEKYLVMQEFGSKYEAETLKSSKKTDLVDVMLYVYDSSDTNSFSYISNLRQQYNLDHIPTLFVATKSDLDLAQQRHEVQPDVYCRRLSLQVPVAVSIKTSQNADVFATICRVAMNPMSYMPGGPERSLWNSRTRSWTAMAVIFSSFGAGLMLFYRNMMLRNLHSNVPGVGLFTSFASWWANWFNGF